MIDRIYSGYEVSEMTLSEVEELIEKEGLDYSGDYGFKIKENVKLVYSEN
jgi:hypothetical protein